MLTSFLHELKRRKVFQVAAIYAITAWLLVQVVVAVEAPLLLPPWVDTLVIVLLGVGFPVALIMAWAFDLTPDGIVVTGPEGTAPEPKSFKIKGAAWLSGAFLVLVLGWMIQGYLFSDTSQQADIIGASPAGLINVSEPVPGFDGRAAIAVLPFVNMSGDREQDYFADGLTEDLITTLQSLGRYPVIARTSTFTYKGKSMDVRTIARELGAGYVLEGSVRKSGDQVRINAQLIDRGGNHIWAQMYDRPVADIFAVQDEITQRIAIAVEPEILANEVKLVKAVRPADMQAWDYYLRAQANSLVFLGYTDLNGQTVDRARNEVARSLAEKAIELDPNFAPAYTLLAHIDGVYTRNLRPEVDEDFVEQAIERAFVNAKRARSLDPFGATACSCHAILMWITGDLEGALRLQRESLALNPASATVHSTLAKLLHEQGNSEVALKHVKTALRLSPKDMTLTRDLEIEAEIMAGLGRYDDAADIAHRAILLTPANVDAHLVRILALYAAGRKQRAKDAVSELAQTLPAFSPLATWVTGLPKMIDPASSRERIPFSQREEWLSMVDAVLSDLGWGGPQG